MKKSVLIVVYCLFLLMSAVCGSLDYLTSGEYAYYLDRRGDLDFFRGYLFFSLDTGDYVIFCRNLNLSTNVQVNYMAQLGDRDGKLSIIKVEGVSDTTPPEYLQGLIDFLNHNEMYQNCKDSIHFGDFFEDNWENYTLLYYYNKVLPFFRFLDITKKGDEKPSYILNTAGLLTEQTVKNFFTMSPVQLDEKKRNIKDLEIPVKKTTDVTINGLSTELDENWVYNDELGSPGYWLKFNSYRDSQITVEIIPESLRKEKNLTNEEICRLSIVTTPKVDYQSITGYSDDKVLYASYSILDQDDIKNYQFFIILNDNKIINFSSFSDVFDANKEYYKKIINNIIQ